MRVKPVRVDTVGADAAPSGVVWTRSSFTGRGIASSREATESGSRPWSQRLVIRQELELASAAPWQLIAAGRFGAEAIRQAQT
jgi:hypothetical protein